MKHIDTSIPLKKDKLLEAALSLMLAKGYHGTTVDEICVQAGVTKGSFFHYFKSKEDVGKAAIEQFERLQLHFIAEAGLNGIHDPLEKLHAFLDFFSEMASNPDSPSSCLVAVMTQELAETSEVFRALCEEKLLNNTKLLKSIFDELSLTTPALKLDGQQLADYFFSTYQGSLILAKARNDREVIKCNIEYFRQYISCLLNNH
ncbi:TetR/AcrR family transcriptional regulator [Paenibacillus sp. YYML68]|uniref:TetR/AcrR family transcriptional regulator n=1 Tax=Paenibacillus sp. YYML68 TaxID=2909250 RepID=UPI00248F60BE|nr:TetR/AcrR family transcriptional regulator [Paenibacillus sp. YYML68]